DGSPGTVKDVLLKWLLLFYDEERLMYSENPVSRYDGKKLPHDVSKSASGKLTQREDTQREFEVALRALDILERLLPELRNLCDEGKREFAKLNPRNPE
ncbi:MAG: hypothetical protein OXF02_02590, partial [Simkaniaceae bacterium]|nr:hypothetical protein [Simkaniaceae bacterium]